MIDAINAGRVPSEFQEDLQSHSNELVNTVNCPRPSDEDDEKKKKDKKKDEKEDEKKHEQEESDDEFVPTESVPTVPEDEE